MLGLRAGGWPKLSFEPDLGTNSAAPVSEKNRRKTKMSKTLRITSVLAAILVVTLVVLPVVFGSGADEQVQQILGTPSVVEKFQAQAGSAGGGDEDSPLVRQAQAFALYLDPPPPPKPPERRRTSRSTRPSAPRPRSPVSAKFELVGTSYYPLRPEMSMALIDQPGKGLRWVRQSSEIGHLIIEEVKDGEIVVRDGQRTFELAPERPEKLSLLKGERPSGATTPPERSSIGSPSPASRVRPVRSRSRRPAGNYSRAPRSRAVRHQMSKEDLEWVERFMEKTEGITDDEEWLKKAEELLSEADSGGRISENEAQHLEQLGKELNDANEAGENSD